MHITRVMLPQGAAGHGWNWNPNSRPGRDQCNAGKRLWWKNPPTAAFVLINSTESNASCRWDRSEKDEWSLNGIIIICIIYYWLRLWFSSVPWRSPERQRRHSAKPTRKNDGEQRPEVIFEELQTHTRTIRNDTLKPARKENQIIP